MTIEEVENTKDIDMQKKELDKEIEVFKKMKGQFMIYLLFMNI